MVVRCSTCNKKVSIVEQEYCKCKCEKMFCPKHKAPVHIESEMGHVCSFDYFINNKDKLAKLLNNQVIKKDIDII